MRRSLVVGITLCLVLGLAVGLGADMKSQPEDPGQVRGHARQR